MNPAQGASDGTIYATAGREMIAFAPAGDVLWQYTTGGNIHVVSTDRYLYAFRP